MGGIVVKYCLHGSEDLGLEGGSTSFDSTDKHTYIRMSLEII